MSSIFYQASIPVFVRVLKNLDAFFEKALRHAEAAKFDPEVLLNARLYPDMHPFSRQIKIATDTATGVAARLAAKNRRYWVTTRSVWTRLKRESRQPSPIWKR